MLKIKYLIFATFFCASNLYYELSVEGAATRISLFSLLVEVQAEVTDVLAFFHEFIEIFSPLE